MTRQPPPRAGTPPLTVRRTGEPVRAAQTPSRGAHGGGRQALVTPTLASDLGPSVMQRRDGTLVSRGPGAVDMEDRTDARGNVTGRGARRRDVLRSLYSGGTLSKRMYDAAQAFIDDCSVASGGGLVANFLAISASASGPRSGLPDAQIDALTRVNRIRNHLGFNDGTVFWRVLFQNRSLADCDAEDRFEHGSAARSLKVTLAALDIWYERNRVR